MSVVKKLVEITGRVENITCWVMHNSKKLEKRAKDKGIHMPKYNTKKRTMKNYPELVVFYD